MASNYIPWQGNPYMNKIDDNQFNNWRNQYYGNKLADLVRPQSFQYTNDSFVPAATYQPQQYQQPQYQQQYAPQNSYTPLRNLGNVYIDNAGNYMNSGDYVRSENMRTNNMDTRGLYDSEAAYYRRMMGR